MSFRHDDPSPDPGIWDERRQALPDLTIPSGLRVTVVAAHPDDETLGAAGLMAEVLAHRGSVDVIIATDGEQSHPHSRTWTPQRLARARREEVRRALNHLGVSQINFLGVPDGLVAQHTARLSDALEITTSDWVVAPWRHDHHPDHDAAGSTAAAHAAAHEAVRLLEYPIWFWHWGGQQPTALPWQSARRLALSPAALRVKVAALAEHHTQIAPLSDRVGDETLLSPAFVAHFHGHSETYLLNGDVRS